MSANFSHLLQLWHRFKQQNHQELPPREPKRWCACVHHVLEGNHELSGTKRHSTWAEQEWLTDRWCPQYLFRFFSPHPVLSFSSSLSSCSMASIWWCLMHTQSMKLLSAWTIRTHGRNWGPPISIRTRLGQTMGETLQPVHMICLSFSLGLSFSLKSGIRGVYTGCKKNIY